MFKVVSAKTDTTFSIAINTVEKVIILWYNKKYQMNTNPKVTKGNPNFFSETSCNNRDL